MSTAPRLILDHECKQGKCACPTTGCWGECNMKRFPLMYTTMSSAIGKNDLIPDGYEVGIRYQLQPVAAPPPAAPAPNGVQGLTSNSLDVQNGGDLTVKMEQSAYPQPQEQP